MGRIPIRQAPKWDTSRLRFDPVTWDNPHVPRRKPKLSPHAIPVAQDILRALLDSPYNMTTAAEAAGLGRTYVRDIFIGKSQNPKTEELQRLAAILRFDLPNSSEPGVITDDQVVDKAADHAGEIAVMGLWGMVDDAARWTVFLEAWRRLPEQDRKAVIVQIIELARAAPRAPSIRREGEDV